MKKLRYKYYCTCVFVLICLLVQLGSVYAQKGNGTGLFDFDCKFYPGDLPLVSTRDFDESGWRALNLTHDWSIDGTISLKNPSSRYGGFFLRVSDGTAKQFGGSASWKIKGWASIVKA